MSLQVRSPLGLLPKGSIQLHGTYIDPKSCDDNLFKPHEHPGTRIPSEVSAGLAQTCGRQMRDCSRGSAILIESNTTYSHTPQPQVSTKEGIVGGHPVHVRAWECVGRGGIVRFDFEYRGPEHTIRQVVKRYGSLVTGLYLWFIPHPFVRCPMLSLGSGRIP